MDLKTILVFRRTDSNDFTGFFLHFIALHHLTPSPLTSEPHQFEQSELRSTPRTHMKHDLTEETCRG